jgi:molybdate transport system substrate-binding protein
MTSVFKFFAGWVAGACLAAGSLLAYGAETVTVFAAASLKNALDEVAQVYQQNTGTKIVAAYAASSALAKQIESGAPADAFISADPDWMDYLAGKNLIKPETRVNLLKNTLALIAPGTSVVKIDIVPGFPLARLLGNDRLAMANPDSVPAGKYGKAALVSLGVWDSLQSKIAPAENVRAALALVSRGETPFGIVYRTDAYADKGVRIVADFPAGSHPAIIYPAAQTAESRSAAAADFLKFLAAPMAQMIFAKHGF